MAKTRYSLAWRVGSRGAWLAYEVEGRGRLKGMFGAVRVTDEGMFAAHTATHLFEPVICPSSDEAKTVVEAVFALRDEH